MGGFPSKFLWENFPRFGSITRLSPVLFLLLILVFVALGFLWGRRHSRPSHDQGLGFLQNEIQNLRTQTSDALGVQTQLLSDRIGQLTTQLHQQVETVFRQVADSQKTVGERLDTASRVVGDVRKELGALGQASQRIFDVGKDIASLHDILRAPKMRGVLGEYFLENLLGQILPAKHFSLQHPFKTGNVVDAVIHLGSHLVPVDAKFPLENFRPLLEESSEDARRAVRRKFTTDVKKHVDAIAGKYILPDEGTYDFAFMYIPAENVYYECIVKGAEEGEESPLAEYALKQRVIPVSPGSFYAYLQAIVMGLRGFQIEENARVIMGNLARLQGDFQRFLDEFDVLGKHLSNAKGKHEDASRRLARFHDKLSQVAEEGSSPPAVVERVEGV
jgi:DNA recombination protein RmuC